MEWPQLNLLITTYCYAVKATYWPCIWYWWVVRQADNIWNRLAEHNSITKDFSGKRKTRKDAMCITVRLHQRKWRAQILFLSYHIPGHYLHQAATWNASPGVFKEYWFCFFSTFFFFFHFKSMTSLITALEKKNWNLELKLNLFSLKIRNKIV